MSDPCRNGTWSFDTASEAAYSELLLAGRIKAFGTSWTLGFGFWNRDAPLNARQNICVQLLCTLVFTALRAADHMSPL